MNVSKNKKVGECRLCGKETFLTFEHVPPRAAFNSTTVRKISGNELIAAITDADRKPWDFSGLKGEDMQRGIGGYYLCQSCNNNTGDWYMKEFVKFSKSLAELLKCRENNCSSCSFALKEAYPLRIFKAIMTMFNDINAFNDDNLKKYLLEPQNMNFDNEKYSLYLYIPITEMMRITPLAAELSGEYTILISEICKLPIGLTLYIDKPKGYNPQGCNINNFSKCKYDEKIDIGFLNLPFLPVNSYFPGDYRSKEEFELLKKKVDE